MASNFSFDKVGEGLSLSEIGRYQEATKNLSEQLLADASRGKFDLGRVLSALPIGNPAYSYGNMLYGVNHRYYVPTIPIDKLNKGYVFFTRPQLNLGDRNIANNSTFIGLTNTNYLSMYRYIRCLLDPRIASGVSQRMKQTSKSVLCSPYLNQNFIFMSLFTNTIKSLSGWPDPNMPTYTSKENMRGGVHRMVDGIMQTYGSFELTATFRNYLGNPMLAIIWYWLNYMSAVYDGTLTPYADMLAANEIDYNTRIWRIVMDEQNRYVRMIGATGASFPISTDIGKFFNLNDTEDLVVDHNEITVTFACIGATYLESILVDEFNKAVCIGCPNMMSVRNMYLMGQPIEKELRKKLRIEKIPYAFIDRFNYRGYPIINYNTMELEWWASTDDPLYTRTMGEIEAAENFRKNYSVSNPPVTPNADEAGKKEVTSGNNPEKVAADKKKGKEGKEGEDWSPPADDKLQEDVSKVMDVDHGLNSKIYNPHKFGTSSYYRWEKWALGGYKGEEPK